MIARGWITRAEVEAALIEAMVANGYVADKGMHAVEATLKSGIDAGMTSPHDDLRDQHEEPVSAIGDVPPAQRHAARSLRCTTFSESGLARRTTPTRLMR